MVSWAHITSKKEQGVCNIFPEKEPLLVKDVIPQSHLAKYGNIKYGLNEKVSTFEDYFYDFSFQKVDNESLETCWMSDAVEFECWRLVYPFRENSSSKCAASQTDKQAKKETKKFVLLHRDYQIIPGSKLRNSPCNRPESYLINSAGNVEGSWGYMAPEPSKNVRKAKSGAAYFPVDFDYERYEVDPKILSKSLLALSEEFEANVSRQSFVLPLIRLPIPVYLRPCSSYSLLTRECGLGVNYHNLILLSPPSQCRWWKRYGSRLKQTAKKDASTVCKTANTPQQQASGDCSDDGLSGVCDIDDQDAFLSPAQGLTGGCSGVSRSAPVARSTLHEHLNETSCRKRLSC